MITATLIRHRELPYCTLGRLLIMERHWFTIEPPCVGARGKSGAPVQSRVPSGRYRLERHNSEAHAAAYALVNPMLGVWHYPWEVPSESVDATCAVLIHPHNHPRESCGGIGPGKEHKQVNGLWGVARSREAMNEIIQLLKRTVDLELVIEDRFPEVQSQ